MNNNDNNNNSHDINIVNNKSKFVIDSTRRLFLQWPSTEEVSGRGEQSLSVHVRTFAKSNSFFFFDAKIMGECSWDRPLSETFHQISTVNRSLALHWKPRNGNIWPRLPKWEFNVEYIQKKKYLQVFFPFQIIKLIEGIVSHLNMCR